jgi:predicted KAP-like P-loop ATPase
MDPGGLMPLLSDIPITGASFDALARKPVAVRLVELIALAGTEQPIVIGLVGGAGTGKTSVLNMANELYADRADMHALSIDAWEAGDAATVTAQLVDGVTKIFADAKVVGSAEKVRERLFSVGDVVSTVARFAGVKVDVKGALERSPQSLREEVMKLTEALARRIVVTIDHVDRLATADQLAVLKLVERWGAFPRFAFVIALDRKAISHDITLDRVVGVELALPDVPRGDLAAFVVSSVTELAHELGVPTPELVVDTIATPRQAKRYLNAITAQAPLAGDFGELCRRLLPK